MNANEPTYGPYLVDGKEYKLAPLTTRRYQSFIRVFTSLPLTDLYQAWNDFQELLRSKVPEDLKERLANDPENVTGEELAEVTVTEADLVPLSVAISQMITQADDEDVLVGLLGIALDIEKEKAAEVPYNVGLEAISDFFTVNPSLLLDSIRFLTGMVNPLARTSRIPATQETSQSQKPPSTPGSTPSPKKPAVSVAGKKKKTAPAKK